MKLLTGLLAAVVLLAVVGACNATVRIADDRGGRIGNYVDRYEYLRHSGQTVIIDGLCASACTIILGAIPHDKICVTANATLGFHAAWGVLRLDHQPVLSLPPSVISLFLSLAWRRIRRHPIRGVVHVPHSGFRLLQPGAVYRRLASGSGRPCRLSSLNGFHSLTT